MSRPKGSKNKKTLLLESIPKVNMPINNISYESVVKDLNDKGFSCTLDDSENKILFDNITDLKSLEQYLQNRYFTKRVIYSHACDGLVTMYSNPLNTNLEELKLQKENKIDKLTIKLTDYYERD